MLDLDLISASDNHPVDNSETNSAIAFQTDLVSLYFNRFCSKQIKIQL